jgi:hypothetical protein
MKNLKLLLAALFAALMVSGNVSAQAKDKKVATVVFDVDIDCGGCKAKIERNLPFEKGVKEFEVSSKIKRLRLITAPIKPMRRRCARLSRSWATKHCQKGKRVLI